MPSKLPYFLSLIMVLSVFGSITLSGQERSVRIGMLLPDLSSTMARDAAQLAIDQANEEEGFRGIPFELVVRTTQGPWGAGSKQSVNLVYEDSVWAFLGALDGRNAHLAEQVATKTHILYLEARTTESTITQAYVPWCLRIVPSDDQQSEAILNHIENHGGGRLAIVGTEGYDSRMAAASFTRISARSGYESPASFIINPHLPEIQQLVEQMIRRNIGHLVITLHSQATLEIIGLIREKMPGVIIYGTNTFTSGIDLQTSSWDAYEEMILISSYMHLSPEGKQFQEAFYSRYGNIPGISAFYVYDGTNLIIKGIRNAGLKREAIKDYLSETRFSGGATGSISFDELGNRTGPIPFTRIRSGSLQLMN